MSDFNTNVIAEFRANEGRVGGPFAGAPMLLLHTIGAKSGTERVHPMMYRPVGSSGESYAVFASKAGAPDNPAWYHNLLAHPDVEIEVGTATVPVRAREARDDERNQIWEAQKRDYPGFAAYEAKTTRVIPVMVLEPRA